MPLERALGGLVRWNNSLILAGDDQPNPRPGHSHPWQQVLIDRAPSIRKEWSAFAAADGRLPRIEEVLAESQGNTGTWRFGLLVANGAPTPIAADLFPTTVATLSAVPGLRSAMWSVLEPGTELPEHVGPNAGMLRYHLGIDCGDDAALRVGATVVPYRDGEAVLFDDTAPHAAWNRGATARITLFCEIERPLDGWSKWRNRAIQRMLGLDARYRDAPRRAAEWHLALNGRRAGHAPH